jgi:hypothetical protein
MARYLLVAHQTADSLELRAAVRRLAASDREASFVLLIPATPVEHLVGWTEGETRTVAQRAGELARQAFSADGIELEAVLVGDANPSFAVEDAFNESTYDQVVVSTLAAKASRWLKMDVVKHLRRVLSVPVVHIEGS